MSGWNVPVVQVSALRQEGFDDLLSAVDRHGMFLREFRRGRDALQRQARHEICWQPTPSLPAPEDGRGTAHLTRLAEQVAWRQLDPRTAARELMDGIT